MAVTYNRMRIDVNEKINDIVTAIAQDTLSRYLDVSLYNNGVIMDLTDHTVRVYVKKTDGKTVFNQAEITDAVNGRFQLELTNQMLAVSGNIELQITVWDHGNTQILSTDIFKITVLPTIRNDEAIESSNEYGVLVLLFQEIQDALDTMNKIIDNFGEPGELAEYYGAETFWQMLEALSERADFESVLVRYIKETINSTIDTQHEASLDQLILGDTKTYTEDGTFLVPYGVNKIRVLAVGGGSGGKGGVKYSNGHGSGGGGGSGGQCVEATFYVTPLSEISIVVGKGGEGSGNQLNNPGGATVVGNLITALGGVADDSNNVTVGAPSAGTGSGKGGGGGYSNETVGGVVEGQDGNPGMLGAGGLFLGGSERGGGGGGGSYGNGGDGGTQESINGKDGVLGGGGGGGYSDNNSIGGAGGDGIVIIYWGVAV